MRTVYQLCNLGLGLLLLIFIQGCSGDIEDCPEFNGVDFQNIKVDNQVIAHSHNDYEQDCPLTKAMSLGFRSIEVDIFPYKETIVVSHEDDLLDIKPTIQSLYLDPLQDILRDSDRQINLLIDLKVYSDDFLNKLHTVLQRYDNILMRRSDTENKNLKVILSGKLPRREIVQNENWTYFFVDGRLTDLGKDISSQEMPLISANFGNIFDFKPSQILSRDEIEQLENIIQRTHDEGKIIRFWNTSDNDIMWAQLTEVGVDVIGVDDLDGFSEFVAN